MIRVTVWNEYNGTQNFPHYPKGLHEYIKDFLNELEGTEVYTGKAIRTVNATLSQTLEAHTCAVYRLKVKAV
jgi:trehalose utilization protein